jgi:hypothetical protein
VFVAHLSHACSFFDHLLLTFGRELPLCSTAVRWLKARTRKKTTTVERYYRVIIDECRAQGHAAGMHACPSGEYTAAIAYATTPQMARGLRQKKCNIMMRYTRRFKTRCRTRGGTKNKHAQTVRRALEVRTGTAKNSRQNIPSLSFLP